MERDFQRFDPIVRAIAMKSVLYRVTIVEVPPSPERLVPDDADDDHVLWCALVIGAHSVVTYDQHLLGLDPFRGVRIVTPEDAYQCIGSHRNH